MDRQKKDCQKVKSFHEKKAKSFPKLKMVPLPNFSKPKCNLHKTLIHGKGKQLTVSYKQRSRVRKIFNFNFLIRGLRSLAYSGVNGFGGQGR